MLQLPHVIEVSFGVWRFRGLRRVQNAPGPYQPHFSDANTLSHSNLDLSRSACTYLGAFPAPCARQLASDRSKSRGEGINVEKLEFNIDVQPG